MAYADLTTEQQGIIDEGTQFIRGRLREMAGNNFDLKLVAFDQTVQPLLDLMLDGDVLPDRSGLAGSADMTVADVELIKNWMQLRSDDIQTNKAIMVKAIGFNA